MPVDPTTQAAVPEGEPIGTAPTPEPIGGTAVVEEPRPIVDPRDAMDPSRIGLQAQLIGPPAAPAAAPAATAPAPASPPGWIREVSAPEPPPTAGGPPPAAPPTHTQSLPPVTYDPTPPAQSQPMSPEDMALNAVVTNPRGFIGGIVHEALDQRVNPAFAAMTETAGAVNNYIGARAKVEIQNAQANVENLYTNVFQQDEAYNSNPLVKRDVDAAFKNMLQNGIQETRYGEFESILTLGSYTPLQAQAALNAVKTIHGVQGNPVSAPNVGTAVVETPTTSQPLTQTDVYLSPEEEQIIAFRERIDPNFRSEYIASKREAITRGDWQF